MKRYSLTATLMLAVIALASAIPIIVGAFTPLTPQIVLLSLLGSAGVVLLATQLVAPAQFRLHRPHAQFGDVGEDEVKAQYKQVQADLKKVNDDLKRHGEEAEKLARKHEGLSAESKDKVDKLLISQTELVARMQAAEQALGKLESGGGKRAEAKTPGQMVIESDQLKAFNPGMPGAIAVKVGSVHAAVTSADSSAGDLIVPQRVGGIIAQPNQRLFVRDLLSWGRTTANSIEFVRETGFVNSANVVSENPSGEKPESDITFELDSAPIATIAHWIRASKQVLADVSQLLSYINGRLMYGLKLKEEAQLLKGSGTGLNLDGIYTQATGYSNPGVYVQNETMIDRLRVALLQVQLAEYEADGIVLNPIDWAAIELTKTDDNAYLFANPHTLQTPGLWGKRVVATKSMDASDFLVGAFQLGAQGWDREDANISISNQDRDNFVKNMITILCEERVGLTVFRPEAFVKGPLDGLAATSTTE